MKNVLTWTLKIFLALVGAILLLQGIMWGFFPETNLATNSIEVSNALGLNMIKSDIGGGLVAGGLFLLLFVFQGNKWFWPMMILGSAFLIIRTVSFISDGYHETIVLGIVLEALVVLSLIGLRNLRK